MAKKPKPTRITRITRQQIIDSLLVNDGVPFHGKMELVPFLRRIWPLSQMPSQDSRFKDAEGDIWQHMVNNDDWTIDYLLFERLNILTIPDEQFAKFLETRVHPLNMPKRDEAEALVATFNQELKNDKFLMHQTGEMSGRPIYKVVNMNHEGLGYSYEVVLSFAGEDRDYVEEVADLLRDNDIALFYDTYEEATLWGKNLIEHLHKVYSSSARYCIMFISKHYAEKVWPTHERRSAFEAAVRSKEEYILPARFDDIEIPGLHKDISYVDLRKKTPKQLADLVMQKLGRTVEEEDEPHPYSTELTDDDIPF